MLRVLFFFVLVFALAMGFGWLADRPGELTLVFNGYQYQVSVMAAAVIMVSVVAAVMLGWWLLKSIWNSPYTVSRYFRVRRRDRGYQALSTGMIAAGAGDAALARKKNREALKLISSDSEPLIHLLDAQTSLLEGDHETAREKFKAMVEDPETRLLGLRGLFLEAERLGEKRAARHYAAQAAAIAPQLGWAAESTLEEKVAHGDYDGAFRIVDAQRASRQVDRDKVNRRRAVLLTARAMTQLDADPLAARNAAQEAVRLAPDLVPAATTAARALLRSGDLRKGAKVIEALWKKNPHPEAAEIYLHARPGDSPQDRLGRARKLEAVRPNHPESVRLVARAALEAGELKLARREAEKLIRLEPREGAFLLMADIEEAETGEQGRVRQWLNRALRAPRDPAWVADGHVAERWAPISPISGRIDAYEWKAPLERAPQTIEAGAELHKLPELDRSGPDRSGPEKPEAAEDAPEAAPTVIEAEPAPAATTTLPPVPSQPAAAAAPQPAREAAAPAVTAPPPPVKREEPRPPRRDAAPADRPSAEVVMFQRPPDDPGVEVEGDEKGGRARLF